jgi:ribosomal protein S18 acetylase RimI-like enzyme
MEVQPLDRSLVELSLNQLQSLDIESVAAGNIEHWTDESFLLELPDKWALSVFVKDDQRIVAYSIISGRSVSRHYAHWHRAVVASTHRGVGLGRLMLDHARKLAVAKGYIGMTAFASPDNLTSLRFLRRLGFLEEVPLKPGPNISLRIRYCQEKQ